MGRGLSTRTAGLLAVAVLAGGLGGCIEALPDVDMASGGIRDAIARGQLTSPRAATVALASLEGAPEAVQTRLRQDLATEAASREITITDEASARYLVRGYLSAYPGDKGVTLAYVYDVFDAGQKQREQRIGDTIDVPSTTDDPWGSVTDQVVATLATRSADDLAVALAGTPEAQAAGAAGPAALAAGKLAASVPSAPPPVN